MPLISAVEAMPGAVGSVDIGKPYIPIMYKRLASRQQTVCRVSPAVDASMPCIINFPSHGGLRIKGRNVALALI